MANNFNYNLRGVQFVFHLQDGTELFSYFNVIDLPIAAESAANPYSFGPITTKPNDTALYAAYTSATPFPVPVEGDPVATTTYMVGLYSDRKVFTGGAIPSAINITSADGTQILVGGGKPNSKRPPVVNLGGLSELESRVKVLRSNTNVNADPYSPMMDYFFALFTHSNSNAPHTFSNLQIIPVGISEYHPLGSMFVFGNMGSNDSDKVVCVNGCIAMAPTFTIGISNPPDPSLGVFPAYGLAQGPDGTFGPLRTIDYNDIYDF